VLRCKRFRVTIPKTEELEALIAELRTRPRHVDDDGTARRKHLHDARGTFCTMLLTEWELTDEEAAEIIGWSKDQVRGIRKVYVDGDRVAMAIAERVAARQRAKQAAQSSLSA
jgi:hypothetical protein